MHGCIGLVGVFDSWLSDLLYPIGLVRSLTGVPGGTGLTGVAFPDLWCLFSVPDPSESVPLRRRLCLLVSVLDPELVGLGQESGSSRTVSPTSFNCLVIDVRGNFGFIDGFRFIVPVGNSPHSKATCITIDDNND